MTDTTAGEGKYDWHVTEHGIATDDEVETAIVRLAEDDAVLAYRIQGRLAAQPSAGAQGEAVAWAKRRIETLDATEKSPDARHLRTLIGRATPAQPDTGDVAALREAYQRWLDEKGEAIEVVERVGPVLAALSKPNAQGEVP